MDSEDILTLIQVNPEKAYNLLFSENKWKNDPEFWKEFSDKYAQSFYESAPLIFENKICWLKLFHELYNHYNTVKNNQLNELKKLNPCWEDFVQSVFLALELEASNIECAPYSSKSLIAVKQLFREAKYVIDSEKDHKAYSLDVISIANTLFIAFWNICLLDHFLDLFLYEGFTISQRIEEQGFFIHLPIDEKETIHFSSAAYYKKHLKLAFFAKKAQSFVSNDPHFVKYDPELHTYDGMVSVMHNSNVRIDTHNDTAVLQVDDKLLEDATSDNLDVRNKAQTELLKLFVRQSFHFNFRQALSLSFFPKEAIDIKSMKISPDEKNSISIYDILCVSSCLVALAQFNNYINYISGKSLDVLKFFITQNLKEKHPEKTNDVITIEVNSTLAGSLSQLKDSCPFLFTMYNLDTLIHILRRIEGLKQKSDIELSLIVDFLSELGTDLPFNPLYRIGEKFFFPYKTLLNHTIGPLIYDYYISDKLFNNSDEYHKKRELDVLHELEQLLKKITLNVKTNLKYKYEKQNNEIDIIAYFPDENILFIIELKLNNVFPRSSKRKNQWKVNNMTKATKQICRNISFLESTHGYNRLQQEFKAVAKTLKIYPLIISDDFHSDHLYFNYDAPDKNVLCISFFEIEQLIKNTKIHEKQNELPLLHTNPASTIIQFIESNLFWKFLNEFDEPILSPKTTYINKAYCMQVKLRPDRNEITN